MDNPVPDSGRRSLVREMLPGALIAAFGIFYTVETTEIGQGASHAAVPPWAFPLVVGLGLIAFGVLLCLFAVLRAYRGISDPEAQQAIDGPSVIAAILVLVAYVVACVPVGFLLSTIVMIPAMARIFGSRALRRDIIYAVLFSVAAYSVFTYGIGVPLPAGLLAGLF